ncbi:MAG: cytochrome [Hydrocarboniphaga sp.]|uniref:cytochrome P450 n=1 Tax=Hydrocarboniphaga sp. TaxID=2033016 RepID=UPI002627B73B|nr:cytochrome P450 [Hydrocarboniphaga sp.]MDB5972728.1 cytochrome [Hydrocarboniphaga sp.]
MNPVARSAVAAPADPVGARPSSRLEIDGRLFNPYSKDFIRSPWDAWDRLVRDYPVCWHKDLQMWVCSSHDACSEMLKDTRFSTNYKNWEHAPAPKPEADKNHFEKAIDAGLFAVEVREHLRLRKLTMPAFSKPVMMKIDAKIRDLIVTCFDEIGSPATFDAFEMIAEKLPVRSIARMVGVPTDMENFFHDFAVNVVTATRINLPLKRREQAIQDTLPGFQYFLDLIRQRRAAPHPGDDFVGSLISASDNGDRLDDYSIVSVIQAVIVAGSDTATDLHTYALQGLLKNPQQFALLKQQPELMENAIIELLRYGAFGKTPQFRFAAQDAEFWGQPIKKGQSILLNLTAAWVDPQKWPNPRQLDITRKMDGNIVFGAGAHFCIGTYLVRVQGGLMIQEFARRFPNAELLNGDGEVDYDYQHHNARRINKLMIKTHL